MAILDAKLPAWQTTNKNVSVTKAEAKTLEGKAPLVIDGGGLGSGTRVLLKNQVSEAQNGLYEVTANEAFAGAGTFGGTGKFAIGGGWTLTRTSDADSSGEVTEGMLVPIEDGETNQDTSWIQRSTGPIEVGVSSQTFEALSALPGGQITKGELENTYVAPLIKEAVIDNSKVEATAGIKASKLDLKASVAASDLATSAKQLFPQLLSSAKRDFAFGSAEVAFPGGSEASSEISVSCGFEGTPIAISFAVTGGGSGFNSWLRVTAKEKGKFKVAAFNPGKPGAGSTAAFDWIAVG